jgi:beta-lactamase regulating signal transducer with metallopeptidase domain
MSLLLESALRSLLLGLLVWTLLKLLRMRDTGTETIIWTFVLIVALSMPLLSHYLPRLLVTVPHLAAGAAPAAARPLSGAVQAAPSLLWLARAGQLMLSSIYLLGFVVCLGRLITGLILTLRLYLRAVPVQADWVRGRPIRASAALKGPASLAHTILLPADFTSWSAAKREAVLAHEAAHIARRDFFVQLAASVHCALFWFSPFAWWLQSKLAEIAESASDEAAVRRLNDPLMYAEILVDVARRAGGAPLIVAMAHGPLIQHRIDRILGATATRNLSPPLRVLVVAALTLVALTVASARAAIGADPASATSLRPVHVTAARTAATTTSATSARKAAAARRREPVSRAAPPSQIASKVDDRETVSYNPRALLDPVYVATRPYVPPSTIVHAGQTFYIRSTERPVAEVSVADGK